MQIKGKSVLKQCFCGKVKRHGEFIPANKKTSENIRLFVEKGTLEIEREMCDECAKKRAVANEEK